MQADPLLWQFVLQIVLILCNAVFACAEIAVLSVNDARLSVLATGGDRRALRLCRMTSQPARFLATIQVAITLSGFLGSAFAADNFSERLVAFLIGAGLRIPEKTLDTIALYYDAELDMAIAAALAKLEPTVLIFLAVVAGFIVIAIYMSIFQMYAIM